jgi:hypothetical protein
MSYTGTQVYVPAESTTKSVSAWLGAKLSGAKLATSERYIDVTLRGAEIRLELDASPWVRQEAKELAAGAPKNVGNALRKTTQRFVIMPKDPGTEPDDVYNELLTVFEVLRTIPTGVGVDPFDGALYFDEGAPSSSAKKRIATKSRVKAANNQPRKAPKRPTRATRR